MEYHNMEVYIMESVFTEKQIIELDKDLNPLLISERQGGSKSILKHIEGHNAIDQANRLFGYGNWGYRTLSCKSVNLIDPCTGESIGITYEAEVELQVKGCMPISDVGQQACSVWNVEDVVMSRRKKEDDSPIQRWEKQNASRTIVDAHEVARKGAVTDAMKRCLRTFGSQFANGLYGDGKVPQVDGDTLSEDQLKTDWARAYNIPAQEIDSRWPKFKVYALQAVVPELTGEHKVKLFATIEKRTKSA
jgi:recombination DNA repair RAD52 pathway protein